MGEDEEDMHGQGKSILKREGRKNERTRVYKDKVYG